MRNAEERRRSLEEKGEELRSLIASLPPHEAAATLTKAVTSAMVYGLTRGLAAGFSIAVILIWMFWR